MIRRPPRSTRTDTLFPYTTRFRSIDLTSARMVKRVIVRGLENHWSLAGNLGSIFYFVTDSGAPRRRIVTMDVASMTRQLREIVPQSGDVLEGAAIIDRKSTRLNSSH